MELIMKVKQVYGKDLIYPGCAKSELISELLRKKTFDSKELHILVKLGYAITLNGHVPDDLKKAVNPYIDLKIASYKTVNMWETENGIEFYTHEQPDNISIRGNFAELEKGDRIRSKMQSGNIAVYEITEIKYSPAGTNTFFARLIKLGYENGVFQEVKDEQN